MRKKLAELLTENMGEIREDYKGRFMSAGETAVVFDDNQDYQTALIYAAFYIGQENDGDDDRIEELMKLRTDSMGLSIVVY